jgi:wyosine [tRNA(Phe)-imidazoG37] synthetase (radical SAM superfamily)
MDSKTTGYFLIKPNLSDFQGGKMGGPWPIKGKQSYIFGPVPSRRLGRSLGIDLVPFKTCTYNCIYCQLGRTTKQTLERKPYVKGSQVMAELKKKLPTLSPPPNYLTFSGSGEPTLHSEIGWIINEIKRISQIPIAVLTNGSLLHLPEVRADLIKADLVIPSLDAASAQLFKFINRPHYSLHLPQILQGLKDFRRDFAGQIWLEIMLCAGINDDPKEIQRLKEVIAWIEPDRIQLNTVIRPPAEEFAYPLPAEQLEKVKNMLGDRVEIIPTFAKAEEDEITFPNEKQILDLLKRRPCTAEEISHALGYKLESVYQTLQELWKKEVIRYRVFSDHCYYEILLEP